MPHRLLLLLLLLVSHCATAQVSAPLETRLLRSAPDLDRSVLRLALTARSCAERYGESPSTRLTVIDYSLPSTRKRLWVFDLARGRLLHQELVAHGKNTGENHARHFSNRPGSLQTSIGLFRTADTYRGSNGYSLRLEGLEPGFNDKAMERAIVMHGAPYVDPRLSRTQGRIGRSWGCPAVRTGIARQLIDTIKGGHFVFSYYPDQQWLKTSQFLNCDRAPHLARQSKSPSTAGTTREASQGTARQATLVAARAKGP